jgi:hypothetical protein
VLIIGKRAGNLIMANQTLFSSFPNEAFSISTGMGDVYSGGAVAFQPQQACCITGVTLLLAGYTGANGQKIALQLFNNQLLGTVNQPGGQLGSFTVPAGNDGSIAEFTCPLSPGVNLAAGGLYWLLAYGLFDAPPTTRIAASWLAGGANPMVVQMAQFIIGNFQPSSVVPAFAVLVSV